MNDPHPAVAAAIRLAVLAQRTRWLAQYAPADGVRFSLEARAAALSRESAAALSRVQIGGRRPRP